MNKIITIGLMLLTGLVAKSQTQVIEYVYDYDANGNRISRTQQIVIINPNNPTAKTDSAISNTDSTTFANTNSVVKQQSINPTTEAYGTATIADSTTVATTSNHSTQQLNGDHKITVYPNPTKGELKIDITNLCGENQGMIMLTDIQGRIIYKNENLNQSSILDLSSQASGNYLLKVMIDGKSSEWVVGKE